MTSCVFFKKALFTALNYLKTNYPAACNSVEKILVDSACAELLLPTLAKNLIQAGVKLLADERALQILSSQVVNGSDFIQPAGPDAFVTEHLDLILSIKIVDTFDEAVQHINTYGSHHTDCIITEDSSLAEKFMKRVDSAGVYWNASTRFADGFRYGFGAEIGVNCFNVIG
jgi:glutamate-5-semialdehyde dehydrogenase